MMRQKRCIVQLNHTSMLLLSRSADRAFPKVMSHLIPGYFVNGRSISGGLVYDHPKQADLRRFYKEFSTEINICFGTLQKEFFHHMINTQKI